MDRRQYLRHFVVLFSGTAATQAVNLVSYPFLARLYTPADFGIFAMFVAVSAIPGSIACARFDNAVPTAPRAGRFAILWLCISIASGMGIVSALGVSLYWLIAGTAGVSLAMPPLLGLCVFLTGFCQAASLYLMRHDFYRLSSASLLVRTGATVAVQMTLALFWATPLALIIGFCVGFAAQGLVLGWGIWGHIPPGPPRVRQMRALFRQYRRQVTVDIPSTFIAAISLNLMTFLLLILFNQRVVGFYSLGQRLAILPLQLFNDALSQVFFQKAARAQEERGHFWNEMKFNLLTSGAISVLVLAGIWLFARPFTILYLGRTWAPAADILLILAPMLAARSLCMSVATAVFVLRRAHWLLMHNILNAALLGLAFVVARATGMGLFPFLTLVAALLTVEYLLFAGALALAARRGEVRATLRAGVAA